MKNINVNVQRPPTNIPLGRQGENLATCVIFDCSGFAQLYGDGTAELLHELKSGTVYPVAIQQDGASVSWTVSASDTATVGAGRAELRWYVGDTLANSAKFRTSVSSALPDTSVSTPPAPQQSWVEEVLAAAQEIKDGAISDDKLAEAIAAYLQEHPIDAGLDEAALAAYLTENGYLNDTALADAIAQALANAKSSGEFNGDPGMDGTDGGYYTPSVDADGNLTWTSSAENMPTVPGTNIKGPQGEAGPAGATAEQVAQIEKNTQNISSLSEETAELKSDLNDYDTRIFALENGGVSGGIPSAFISALQEILLGGIFDNNKISNPSAKISALSAYAGGGSDTPVTPPSDDSIYVAFSGTTATINNLKNLTVSYAETVATVGV